MAIWPLCALFTVQGNVGTVSVELSQYSHLSQLKTLMDHSKMLFTAESLTYHISTRVSSYPDIPKGIPRGPEMRWTVNSLAYLVIGSLPLFVFVPISFTVPTSPQYSSVRIFTETLDCRRLFQCGIKFMSIHRKSCLLSRCADRTSELRTWRGIVQSLPVREKFGNGKKSSGKR